MRCNVCGKEISEGILCDECKLKRAAIINKKEENVVAGIEDNIDANIKQEVKNKSEDIKNKYPLSRKIITGLVVTIYGLFGLLTTLNFILMNYSLKRIVAIILFIMIKVIFILFVLKAVYEKKISFGAIILYFLIYAFISYILPVLYYSYFWAKI